MNILSSELQNCFAFCTLLGCFTLQDKIQNIRFQFGGWLSFDISVKFLNFLLNFGFLVPSKRSRVYIFLPAVIGNGQRSVFFGGGLLVSEHLYFGKLLCSIRRISC
jgi:hypothetical protein